MGGLGAAAAGTGLQPVAAQRCRWASVRLPLNDRAAARVVCPQLFDCSWAAKVLQSEARAVKNADGAAGSLPNAKVGPPPKRFWQGSPPANAEGPGSWWYRPRFGSGSGNTGGLNLRRTPPTQWRGRPGGAGASPAAAGPALRGRRCPNVRRPAPAGLSARARAPRRRARLPQTGPRCVENRRAGGQGDVDTAGAQASGRGRATKGAGPSGNMGTQTRKRTPWAVAAGARTRERGAWGARRRALCCGGQLAGRPTRNEWGGAKGGRVQRARGEGYKAAG